MTCQWSLYQLLICRSCLCAVTVVLDPVNTSPLATSGKLWSVEAVGKTLQEEGVSLSGSIVHSCLLLPWTVAKSVEDTPWVLAALWLASYGALSASQWVVLLASPGLNPSTIQWGVATLSPTSGIGRPLSSLLLPWVLWLSSRATAIPWICYSLEFLNPC